MLRRTLLLGVFGAAALVSVGCQHRRVCAPCGGSLFPGRRAILAPLAAPAPLVGGYESGPIGYGGGHHPEPGCVGCATSGAGMPHAAAPVGYQPHYAGAGIPHDSMLLHTPTVLPPGAGSPTIIQDPPKTMPMTGGK